MKKHIWLVAGCALLFSLIVTACGDESGGKTVALAAVTVPGSASGSTVELVQGQELIIRLASNPTTGYSWSQVEAAAGVLTKDGSPVYEQDQPDTGEPPVGAGGTEVWRFTAASAGQQDLRFEYRRPWETGVAPAETVSFRVTVR